MAPTPVPLPVPALFPPADGGNHTWPAPNYVNPETRTWAAPASLVVLFIFTFMIFVLRINSRFRLTCTPGLDDYLIIASMLLLLALTIATVLGLRIYGFQLHIYDQTPETYITVRQITLAIETIYLGTTTLTKLSILCFYRRITSSLLSKSLRIAVWASIFVVAAYGITFVFVLIFTCWPVEAYVYRFTKWWLLAHPHYKCHGELVTLVIIISTSTALDFLACILPMFLVRKLRLPSRQKMALCLVFGLGIGTCAVGVLRIHFAHRVYYYVKSNDPTYDITWESLGGWVSTCVEANLGIMCASAPALRPYCRCFESAVPVRSFGWYGRHNDNPAPNTNVSRDPGRSHLSRAATAVVRMSCCFGFSSFTIKIGGSSLRTGRSSGDTSVTGDSISKNQKATLKNRAVDAELPRISHLDEFELAECRLNRDKKERMTEER